MATITTTIELSLDVKIAEPLEEDREKAEEVLMKAFREAMDRKFFELKIVGSDIVRQAPPVKTYFITVGDMSLTYTDPVFTDERMPN